MFGLIFFLFASFQEAELTLPVEEVSTIETLADGSVGASFEGMSLSGCEAGFYAPANSPEANALALVGPATPYWMTFDSQSSDCPRLIIRLEPNTD